MTQHICMIVPDPMVHGGIAAVTAGYYGSRLEKDYRMTYVQSYCDGSRMDKLRKALGAYRQFRRILRKDPPELVHIHSSFGPSFYRKLPFILMAARRGIPVVNHIHGSAFDALYTDASERKKRLVRRVYGKCTRMIVLSEHWKKVLGAAYPEERIRVVPNYGALHPEVLDEPHCQKRLERQQILYLGVLTEGKGMKEMPEVIRRVTAACPGARFVFGGTGDPDLAAEGLPAETVREHVFFPGWVRGEEKERLLEESAVFLLPSHMEAMPMSLLEAMGYGLPMVTTRVGGIPALAGEGPQAALCPVGESGAMADAIVRLLGEPAAWREASAASYQRARSEFSFEAHLERLEAVYREVLAADGCRAHGNPCSSTGGPAKTKKRS